jgi:hypothetical protein
VTDHQQPLTEIQALAWLHGHPDGTIATTVSDLARSWGWNRSTTSRRVKAWVTSGQLVRTPGPDGRSVFTASTPDVPQPCDAAGGLASPSAKSLVIPTVNLPVQSAAQGEHPVIGIVPHGSPIAAVRITRAAGSAALAALAVAVAWFGIRINAWYGGTLGRTPEASTGEIQDRYRNLGPLQGIGYPMFTLEHLIAAAEILRIAGFDPYAYRGRHEQSIEMALAYYACVGKRAGFGKTVTAENSASCPNAAQYYGKIVDGVDQNETFGAYRFPNDQSITEVETAAKTASSSGPCSLDAILFGKWRD